VLDGAPCPPGQATIRVAEHDIGLVYVAEEEPEAHELAPLDGERVGRVALEQIERVAGTLAEPVRLGEGRRVLVVDDPG
jgi:hypothetical protein